MIDAEKTMNQDSLLTARGNPEWEPENSLLQSEQSSMVIPPFAALGNVNRDIVSLHLGFCENCFRPAEKQTFQALALRNKRRSAQAAENIYYRSLKNERVRMLTVAEDVMDVLREQKAWQEQQARALGSAFQNPDNLVFTNEFGRFVANQAVYRNYKSIMKKIGLEDMKFHDLRHTFAVNSLKAGDDIKTVQENLGHATASFTLGTYAHATIGMKRESAKRMENYIQSLRKSG